MVTRQAGAASGEPAPGVLPHSLRKTVPEPVVPPTLHPRSSPVHGTLAALRLGFCEGPGSQTGLENQGGS